MNKPMLVTTALVFAAWAAATGVRVAEAATVTEQTAVAPAKPVARMSADQLYKANCTRCHSELPKLQPSAMRTVMMHMRVRANLSKADARDIADYLTR